MTYRIFFFVIFLFFYCVSPAYCLTTVLNKIYFFELGSLIMVANVALGGLAVAWGLRKAIKFVNRS